MTVTIEVPDSVADHIRAAGLDVERLAREGAFVAIYREGFISGDRQGFISGGRLAELLGMARMQVDGLLKRHNVTEDLPTAEEIGAQLDTIWRITG